MNLTIQVPPGATQHGDPNILCILGPPWKNGLLVISFLATNYVAHAATVKSTPGEGTAATVCNFFLALCFPTFGLMRALNAIARGARFGGSEIKNACRAGALCMVVRSPDWRPHRGQQLEAIVAEDDEPEEQRNDMEVHYASMDADMINYFPPYAREDSSAWAFFDTIGARAYVDTGLVRVHGTYSLPEGYTFAIVPRNTRLTDVDADIASAAAERNRMSTQVGANPVQYTRNSDSDNITGHALHARLVAHETQGTPSTNHLDQNESNKTIASDDSPSDNISDSGRAVDGYALANSNQDTSRRLVKSDISSSYNAAKAIASLIQALAAIGTLLLHRSDVTNMWGYASFHLTVIPYLVMTIVNFVCNSLTPDYACLYMVESRLMREARDKGGVFTGTVAAMEDYQGPLPQISSEKEAFMWTGFKAQQIRRLAAILTGRFDSIIIDMRKHKRERRISKVRVTCLKITESRAFVETIVDHDEQNRTADSGASGRSEGLSSHQRACLETTIFARSDTFAYDERFHRTVPQQLHVNDGQLGSPSQISFVVGRQTGSHRDCVLSRGHSEAANGPAEMTMCLQSETGRRYHVQSYRPERIPNYDPFSSMRLAYRRLYDDLLDVEVSWTISSVLESYLPLLYSIMGATYPVMIQFLDGIA